MNELLQNLVKLQSLEFAGVKNKNVEASLAELRGKIPPQILGHYDRLVAHGKKGLAAVRDQVCTGCHMHLPIGVVTTLMRDDDIQLCDNCGRYLYLPEATKAEVPKPTAKPGPARRPRKSKGSMLLV
jgi:predicted  nucleic acid-binding Zn-ribbon protein